MPTGNDDDDTAAHHGGGELIEWLTYKVWKVPGYALLLAVLLLGAFIGHKL